MFGRKIYDFMLEKLMISESELFFKNLLKLILIYQEQLANTDEQLLL